MGKTAIYPGSFDPFTNGHLDMVRKARPEIMEMYDKNGWEMGVFYLENGHAEIRDMMSLKEEFDV